MKTENTEWEEFACLDPELGQLLQPFLEGELDAQDGNAFKAHLKLCASCSEEALLRTDLARRFRENWPSYTSLENKEGGGRPAGRGRWFSSLVRWFRSPVPIAVPAALAAILLAVVLFDVPRGGDRNGATKWVTVAERVTYSIPMEMRDGAEEAPVCRVRQGDALEIVLAWVPSAGHPIRLVVDGLDEFDGQDGLPFRMVEGFPVLTAVVPLLDPGTYQARVVSGEAAELVRTFLLVVEKSGPN